MTDCKGLLGKWFGHKFEKYVIKSKIPAHREVNLHPTNMRFYMESLIEISEIRCKRCGCKTDE